MCNDIYRKYERVVPLKDNKGVIITNAFQNIFDANQTKYG